MNIVKQEVNKIFPFTSDFYSNIDSCAEVARLSRGKEGSDRESNIRTVNYLIKNRHDEPLEFCPIYIDLIKFGVRYSQPITVRSKKFADVIKKLVNIGSEHPNPHTRIFNNHSILVTTLREIVEGLDESTPEHPTRGEAINVTSIYDDIKFITLDDTSLKPLVYAGVVKPRISVIVTTNRQIATELSRHRCLSKNWESTRFVTYNGGLTICLTEFDKSFTLSEDYYNLLCKLEEVYKSYSGLPEVKHLQAFLLPSGLKVSCGFAAFTDDWANVALKRTTKFCGNPHKYIVELVSEISGNVKKAVTYEESAEAKEKKKLEDNINDFVKNILPDELKSSDYNEVLTSIFNTVSDFINKPKPKIRRSKETNYSCYGTCDCEDSCKKTEKEPEPKIVGVDCGCENSCKKTEKEPNIVVDDKDTSIVKVCNNCRHVDKCPPRTQLDCLFNKLRNWEAVDSDAKPRDLSNEVDDKKVDDAMKAITDMYSTLLDEISELTGVKKF